MKTRHVEERLIERNVPLDIEEALVNAPKFKGWHHYGQTVVIRVVRVAPSLFWVGIYSEGGDFITIIPLGWDDRDPFIWFRKHVQGFRYEQGRLRSLPVYCPGQDSPRIAWVDPSKPLEA